MHLFGDREFSKALSEHVTDFTDHYLILCSQAVGNLVLLWFIKKGDLKFPTFTP